MLIHYIICVWECSSKLHGFFQMAVRWEGKTFKDTFGVNVRIQGGIGLLKKAGRARGSSILYKLWLYHSHIIHGSI